MILIWLKQIAKMIHDGSCLIFDCSRIFMMPMFPPASAKWIMPIFKTVLFNSIRYILSFRELLNNEETLKTYTWFRLKLGDGNLSFSSSTLPSSITFWKMMSFFSAFFSILPLAIRWTKEEMAEQELEVYNLLKDGLFTMSHLIFSSEKWWSKRIFFDFWVKEKRVMFQARSHFIVFDVKPSPAIFIFKEI